MTEEEGENMSKADEMLMIKHNKMICEIINECEYMIKNRNYMNDIAIKKHAEKIKDIAKFYIQEPTRHPNKQ